ncbi:MAG: hypothetical protein ACYDCK_07055 [Thermoplasmatota archaeon]
MPVSPIEIGIGFVVGVIATAIAWQLSTKSVRNPERTRVSAVWGVQEVIAMGDTARIAAERIGTGVRIPEGSHILLKAGATDAVPADVIHTCEVREHPDVAANYVLGRDRALVFSGHIEQRSLALWTDEPAAVGHLANDFDRAWAAATPYYETVAAQELLSGGPHKLVAVSGVASEQMEFRGRKMMRLNDNGAILGVSAGDSVPDLAGVGITVFGKVHRENGGVFVEAQRIERLPQQAARPAWAPAR